MALGSIPLLLMLLSAALASDSGEVPDFSKMRVKQLVALLAERGLECKGCAEKVDLVKMAEESWHLPLKPATSEEEGAASEEGKAKGPRKPVPKEKMDRDIDDLIKKMCVWGGGHGAWAANKLIELIFSLHDVVLFGLHFRLRVHLLIAFLN